MPLVLGFANGHALELRRVIARALEERGRGEERAKMLSIPSDHGSTRLPAGTAVTAPRRMTPQSLRIRDWVWLGGHPYRISDLRARPDGGRVLYLSGHIPVSWGARQRLLAYHAPGPECP
jgi:hypothetical protein